MAVALTDNGWRADMGGIANEGVSCWRRVIADRVTFLFDAATYYEALAAALERAHRTVLILGWDIDSRVWLRRRSDVEPATGQLGPLLQRIASSRPELQVYLLAWDYALIYALERGWAPLYNVVLRAHHKIHYQVDDGHPPGASHHQKIVVIDDQLAFTGGIDLTNRRWDTTAHLENDPRRVDPSGQPFAPYHDVQIAIAGAAARTLGELARERWHRATGRRLRRARAVEDPWPDWLRPELEHVPVAIARTDPAYQGRAEVREIERLYLESIAAARRHIYIENQYVTAGIIRDALARRLQEPDGPEILLVGPKEANGWLENGTMGVLRARVFGELLRADRFGRFRFYYPHLASAVPIYVHSKVMVVDERALCIGSSNLTNRSMGLDSECNVLLEDEDCTRTREVIGAFRSSLLGEHLGVSAEAFSRELQARGSLIQAVESLRSSGRRSLSPVEPASPEWLERAIPAEPPFDPPAPLQAVELFERLVPEEIRGGAGRPMLKGALILVALLLLAAAWQWTPLVSWIDPRLVASWADPIRGTWLEPLVAISSFVTAGLLLFPLTLLVVETAAVFGPAAGFFYSLVSALVCALLGFSIGRHVRRRTVRKLAGTRVNRISRALARGGVFGVMAIRLLPIAPFTIVNLVAGASHLRFGEFSVGSALGLLPGLLALTVLGDRLQAALSTGDPGSIMLLVATALAILAAALALSRWLARRTRLALERRAGPLGDGDGSPAPSLAKGGVADVEA